MVARYKHGTVSALKLRTKYVTHNIIKYNTFLNLNLYQNKLCTDQPRGLVVNVSDHQSFGSGFDSRLYHGNFSLIGEDPHGDHGLGS
jgi:hypothetical protein